MNLQAMIMSPIGDARHLRQRPRSAAAVICRVFQANESRDAIVLVIRPNLSFDVLNVEHAEWTADEASRNTAERCCAACFVIDDMTGLVDQDLVTLLAMGSYCHLVRLRSRAVVDGGFFAE